MKVAWKLDGIFKADPNKVASEIDILGEEYKPSDIVRIARDSNSELHKCFEWDDSIAAEKYRETQARKIVCNLVIVREGQKEEKSNVRYIVCTGKNDQTYTQTKLILRNETEYERLLETALRELRAFKAKYKCLSELQEFFEMID